MPTLVIIIAILGAVVGFLDFMVGGPGNRRMKQGLVDFYVATEAGDWTALYRHPARALLSFMQRWFGRHRFAVSYFLMTCMISISLTTILFVFSMTWSYIHALKTETSCAVPVFARFLQIPAYMSPFLIYIMLVNIIVDYLSWSLAQLALETLADSRGRKALLLILSMLVAAVLILFAIYTIYLPLSLTVQLRDMGINIPVSGFFQILSAHIHQNWQLFRLPQPLFHIDCTTRPYSVFSITY